MIRYIILLLFVMILQSTVVNLIEVAGYVPDLRLIFIVYCALKFGPILGASMGFLSGFIMDVYSFDHLGAGCLAGALSGYIVGLANEHVIELDRISKILLLGFFCFFHDFWYSLGMGANKSGMADFFLNQTIPATVYTLIIGAAFIYVMETDLSNES